MEIWCDESGGLDAGLFVVAAVSGEPRHAATALRRIKKVARVTGELHSFHLNLKQIERIVTELSSHHHVFSASVFASRSSTPWSVVLEAEIWGQLVVQSSLDLYSPAVRCIVSDRPRYKNIVARRVLDKVAVEIAFRSGLPPVATHWNDSQCTPGIQLADFISNLVWRSLRPGPEADACRSLLERIKPDIAVRSLRACELSSVVTSPP